MIYIPVVPPVIERDFEFHAPVNDFTQKIGIRWEDEKDFWYFPLEPVVVVSGGNRIVKRNALKIDPQAARRGTVKELWQQNDYSITISGLLMNNPNEPVWTDIDIQVLRAYLEGRKPLVVQGDVFDTLNIRRMVVESWSFPFTAGDDNQSYSISLVSDDEYSLLINS
jgi:hypothetical protein